MNSIIKFRIIGLFFIYTLFSIISILTKMTFYPKALIILFLPFIIIRFINYMNQNISIGISFLLIMSSYWFWNNYIAINVIGYIISIFMILALIIDYLVVVDTYEFFNRELIPNDTLLYYLNPKYIIVILITIGSFITSIIIDTLF